MTLRLLLDSWKMLDTLIGVWICLSTIVYFLTFFQSVVLSLVSLELFETTFLCWCARYLRLLSPSITKALYRHTKVVTLVVWAMTFQICFVLCVFLCVGVFLKRQKVVTQITQGKETVIVFTYMLSWYVCVLCTCVLRRFCYQVAVLVFLKQVCVCFCTQ